MSSRYSFFKAPANGLPEFTSGGYGVTIIPGFGDWVLIGPASKYPPGISTDIVVDFLDGNQNAIATAREEGHEAGLSEAKKPPFVLKLDEVLSDLITAARNNGRNQGAG